MKLISLYTKKQAQMVFDSIGIKEKLPTINTQVIVSVPLAQKVFLWRKEKRNNKWFYAYYWH